MSDFLHRVRLVLPLCFTIAAFAQPERGTIIGTVRVASGAVVPTAKVVLTNPLPVVISAVTNPRRPSS